MRDSDGKSGVHAWVLSPEEHDIWGIYPVIVAGCLQEGLHLQLAGNGGEQRSPQGTWRKPSHRGMQIRAAGSGHPNGYGSGQYHFWLFILCPTYTSPQKINSLKSKHKKTLPHFLNPWVKNMFELLKLHHLCPLPELYSNSRVIQDGPWGHLFLASLLCP